MLDRVVILVKCPNDEDFCNFVKVNRKMLKRCEIDGNIFYQSEKAKDVYLYADIDKLIISISVHKYWNRINNKGRFNNNKFTIKDAIKAGAELHKDYGFDVKKAIIKSYEIGVNIEVEKPTEIINLINSYTTNDMFTNALFLTEKTNAIKGKTKVIKVYDKSKEIEETHKVKVPECVRIETEVRNKKELKYCQLFSEQFLRNRQKLLEKDIKGLRFEPKRITAKNQSLYKYKELVKNIHLYGIERAKYMLLLLLERGTITKAVYNDRIKFLKEFDLYKHKFKIEEIKQAEKFKENALLVVKSMG